MNLLTRLLEKQKKGREEMEAQKVTKTQLVEANTAMLDDIWDIVLESRLYTREGPDLLSWSVVFLMEHEISLSMAMDEGHVSTTMYMLGKRLCPNQDYKFINELLHYLLDEEQSTW